LLPVNVHQGRDASRPVAATPGGGFVLFVPYVPHAHRPSERAEQLSRRLAEAIEEFRRAHSDLSSGDVQAALQLAAHRTGGGAKPLTAALLIAILVVIGVVAAALAAKPQADTTVLVPAIGVLVALLVFGLMLFLKSR
jgi:hypothetical protein